MRLAYFRLTPSIALEVIRLKAFVVKRAIPSFLVGVILLFDISSSSVSLFVSKFSSNLILNVSSVLVAYDR